MRNTMRKIMNVMNVMLVASTLAFTSTSCNKDGLDIGNPAEELTFINSETVPAMTVAPGTPLGLVQFISANHTQLIKIEANVPWITGTCDGMKNYINIYEAFIETVDQNGDPIKGTDITRVENGTGYIKARPRDEHSYTGDDQYILVENPFAGHWVNYCGDGPLQLIFTIRTVGTEGTREIDFSNPLKSASKREKDKFDTYARGTVKAISSVTSGSEKRSLDAQKAWGGHYPALANDSYAKAEYVTLTVTNGENDIDINVWGQSRENEISRLLEYIKVGDSVEIPVTKMNDNSTEINRVHSSAVLKLD